MEVRKESSPQETTRLIVRQALKATLATLDRASGHPYASLVTIATDPAGAPVMLISRLALHTQNIEKDARVSLLFDGTNAVGDPLAGGRVTLVGRAEKTAEENVKQRFLSRQPHAEMYAGFADFAFYRVVLARAHFIGGFGRIVDLPAGEVLLDLAGAEALVSAERDIIEHMNSDHAGALELYATALLGAESGPWRMTGIDPEGLDLVLDGHALRLVFQSRLASPEAVRRELKRLSDEGRTHCKKV